MTMYDKALHKKVQSKKGQGCKVCIFGGKEFTPYCGGSPECWTNDKKDRQRLYHFVLKEVKNDDPHHT